MIESLRNMFKIPELRQKLLFTAGLLIIYRMGAHVPVPGIDLAAMSKFWAQQSGLLGMLNMFSGNAFKNFSVFAMGIMPYINASIILQLLTVVIPYFEALSKEGPEGRKKITKYTRWGTVGLAAVQAAGLAIFMANQNVDNTPVVPNADWVFYFVTVLSLTAGTAFIMWLGEQITERGIGNGISIIIFAGIVAGLFTAVIQSVSLFRSGNIGALALLVTPVIIFCVTALTVIMTLGQRRVPIQQAKRIVGRKVYGGASHFLPLRVNFAGVIPVIFASAIMMLPSFFLKFFVGTFMNDPQKAADLSNYFVPGGVLWNLGFVITIVFFTFFYTAIVVKPAEMADNMKKNGSFIPGVRPGKATAEYIEKILTRITLVGAIFLALISIFPQYIIQTLGLPGTLDDFLGGTALLIIVGVALDTLAQVESHLMMRHYGSLLDPAGKGRGIRGR